MEMTGLVLVDLLYVGQVLAMLQLDNMVIRPMIKRMVDFFIFFLGLDILIYILKNPPNTMGCKIFRILRQCQYQRPSLVQRVGGLHLQHRVLRLTL